MSAYIDQLFERLRPSRFSEENDPNSVLGNQFAGIGNIHPTGFLDDDSVTSDTIRTDAVIARHITAEVIDTQHLAAEAVTAAKIEANTITANEIAANTITANEIAAATITATEIASATITATKMAADSIAAAHIQANTITADEIAANTITANEIAANTITASEIAADAITTNELAANAVITENLLAANVTSGKIELTISGKNFGANDGTTGAPGVYFDSASNSGLSRQFIAFVGTVPVVVQGGSIAAYFASTATLVSGNLAPTSDNAVDLGSTGSRWATVYRVGESAVSDEREKQDIADAPLGLEFVNSLKPRVFRWRDTNDTQAREAATVDADAMQRERHPHEQAIARIRRLQLAGRMDEAEGNARVEELQGILNEIEERYQAPAREALRKRRPGRRLHYGLIAQEVKAALDAAGIDSMDAGFWQEAPTGEQSLSYSELTIPLLRAVQELSDRVAQLENQ